MRRSTKKQNYRLFVKYFSEELTKQTNNTLKDGFVDLITKDMSARYAINHPEFWHKAMRQQVIDLIPYIKQDCFKDPSLKELLLSRMNDNNTHYYETPDEVAEWLNDDNQW